MQRLFFSASELDAGEGGRVALVNDRGAQVQGMLISDESPEVASEAIYMLLNARKLLLILTPSLTLLTALSLVYYVVNHHQQQQRSRHQHQQRPTAVERRATSDIISASSDSRFVQQQQQRWAASDRSSEISLLVGEHLGPGKRLLRHEPAKQQAMKPANVSLRLKTTTTAAATGSADGQHLVSRISQFDPDDLTSGRLLLNETTSSSSSQQTSTTTPNQQQQQQPHKTTPRHYTTTTSTKNHHKAQAETSGTLGGQQQQQQAEPIDVELDLENFILYNRCSHRCLWVWISKRTRRAHIGSRQLDGRNQSALHADRQLDSQRLKLLSMVVTVESVHRDSPALRNSSSADSGAGESHGNETATNADQQQEHRSSAVRLRANLTELYICFNSKGKLEAKVSRLEVVFLLTVVASPFYIRKRRVECHSHAKRFVVTALRLISVTACDTCVSADTEHQMHEVASSWSLETQRVACNLRGAIIKWRALDQLATKVCLQSLSLNWTRKPVKKLAARVFCWLGIVPAKRYRAPSVILLSSNKPIERLQYQLGSARLIIQSFACASVFVGAVPQLGSDLVIEAPLLFHFASTSSRAAPTSAPAMHRERPAEGEISFWLASSQSGHHPMQYNCATCNSKEIECSSNQLDSLMTVPFLNNCSFQRPPTNNRCLLCRVLSFSRESRCLYTFSLYCCCVCPPLAVPSDWLKTVHVPIGRLRNSSNSGSGSAEPCLNLRFFV